MTSPSDIGRQVFSGILKFNWFILLACLLLVCSSSTDSKPTDIDQLSEHHLFDSFYPTVLYSDDLGLVERASPRLGRASPRLGRASPRLGRRAAALLISRLNHAGRYGNGDEDAASDYAIEVEPLFHERRASPRLGRAIEFDDEQQKNA